MSQLSYDITSPQAILEFAKGLSGKTLAEASDLANYVENLSNKGDLGSMVEKYYFHHTPPNNHDPDFAEAGVELKTTGVTKSKVGDYRAKERLVLTLINYVALVDEDWNNSTFLHKCRLMLILFYLYEKEKAVYDRRFVYEPVLWEFPDADLAIIKNDWETIKAKVKDGKAHELSEGDTFYLKAARKGSGGTKEPLQSQPFSNVKAKSRAFSLKRSYLDVILHSKGNPAVLNDSDVMKVGLEDATISKFRPYIGMSVEELSGIFRVFKQGKNDKSFYRKLTMKILGTTRQTLPEFEKADIELKTIRLKKNGTPEQDMSFPNFNYMDMVDEQWENSTFYKKLTKKFFFVVFMNDNEGILRLHKVMYWNMPYADRNEAKKVWATTKERILNHHAEDLPKISDSRVAHVRPHGADGRDTLPTPQGDMLVKKCFWLNKLYLKNIVS